MAVQWGEDLREQMMISPTAKISPTMVAGRPTNCGPPNRVDFAG